MSMMSAMMSDKANDVGNGVGYDVGNGVRVTKMASHDATPFLSSFIQKTFILSCQ